MRGNLLEIAALLAFSVILVMRCIIEFWLKGLHLFAWDILLISGLTLLPIGMWLSMDVPRRIEDTLTHLVHRGILQSTEEELQRVKRALKNQTHIWAHTGSLIVGIAILLAFFVAFKLPFPHEKIPLTILEVLGGYIAGWYLGRMASYGTLGLLLKQRGIALQVKPGDLDGVAGMEPIGSFYFFEALVTGIPALFLTGWLVLIPFWPVVGRYERWKEPYLGLLPIALLFEILAFLVPIWFFHREMQRQKTALLKDADTLRQNIVRLHTELAELRDSQQYHLLQEQLSYMTNQYRNIERMPTWPVDVKTWRRFTLNNIILLLLWVNNLIG